MNNFNQKKYDIFLSYNSQDKTHVEAIALLLEERGIAVFLDEWHLVPGEPWQEALEDALDSSSACAVFLGPNGLGSWQNEEMRSAIEDRVLDKSFRVIPVVLPNANLHNLKDLPRFLRRLNWVDFQNGIENKNALENFIAGIRGNAPRQTTNKKEINFSHLRQGILHILPPAPLFVGRTKELSILRQFWEKDNTCNVFSLIGLGGAGKTAISAEFLSTLLNDVDIAPESLFVWSFYVDQEVNNFLRTAYQYFSYGGNTTATGAGMLYYLAEVLSKGGRKLIIMDGLERVQRPCSDERGIFGEVEDPLLRQVLSRLAFGTGTTKCLITSRFPISDLSPWNGKNYQSLEVDQLDVIDAHLLLRNHGVKGNDNALNTVIKEYGAHALTLDHLGTYLAEFCDGDPSKADELEDPRNDSDIREERKLSRVLKAYELALTKNELDVLMRFCIFRFGATVETLFNLFSKTSDETSYISGSLADFSQADLRRVINRLVKLHLILHEKDDQYTAHPAVRDHFYKLFTDTTVIHKAVGSAYQELSGLKVLEEWERIVAQYGATFLLIVLFDVLQQTKPKYKRKNFSKTDYVVLLEQIENILKRANDRISYSDMESLENLSTGLGTMLEGFKNQRIFSNNSAELMIKESIILHDSSRFGYLLSHERLPDLANQIVNIVKSQSYIEERRGFLFDLANQIETFAQAFKSKISPQIIDQFSNCVTAFKKGETRILPAIALHSSKLAIRPGIRYPDDPATLELIEELIYHSIKANDSDGAYHLYSQRLGGREYLGKEAGEFARGVRILRSFPICPNKLDLAWYLRGVGDLEGSMQILKEINPIWIGPILCLQGYLSRVVNEKIGWANTLNIAAFLSGSSNFIDNYLGWGETLITADLYLLRGELTKASEHMKSNKFSVRRYVPEHIRGHLVSAEIERAKGNLSSAIKELENVAPWILRSSSVEHLCYYHLVHAKVLIDQNQLESADSELKEGLHLSRRCKYALYHIDFLNEQGEFYLRMVKEAKSKGLITQYGNLLNNAEKATQNALYGILKDSDEPAHLPNLALDDLSMMGAAHPECQYAWGEAKSLFLLGKVMLEKNDRARAKDFLQRAISLQNKLSYPTRFETQKLLLRI